jgi:(E)-4-hydroxy-3-methylbut-2-enyl-diphosphate synthase
MRLNVFWRYNKLWNRNTTNKVRVGNVVIGGGSDISVQSMSKVLTTDIKSVLQQCEKVRISGGDLIRVSIPDEDSAFALREIVKNSPLPIIADIHFDYKLALKSLEAGVAKLRINPGNIGSPENVKIIAKEAKDRSVPIRIGVNAGSLPKKILRKFGQPTPEAMVLTVEREIEIFKEIGFEDIIVSLKSSSPILTLNANLLYAKKFPYPLHIGITESGFGRQGVIASTLGLGLILSKGIGDTIRVSLSEEPQEEVKVGREILRFLGLRDYRVRVISCPTCARAEADIFKISREIWEEVKDLEHSIEIAVMGCVVNGPGEASHADIGVACGKTQSLIFEKGQPVEKVTNSEIINKLLIRIDAITSKNNKR